MLLLTRRENEIISIDKNIYFKVLAIQNKQVCIGIHAPKGNHILRTELLTGFEQALIESIMKNSQSDSRGHGN